MMAGPGFEPAVIALASLLTFAMLCMAVPGAGFVLSKKDMTIEDSSKATMAINHGEGFGLFNGWLELIVDQSHDTGLRLVQAFAVISVVAALPAFLSSAVDYKYGVATTRTGTSLLILSLLLIVTCALQLSLYSAARLVHIDGGVQPMSSSFDLSWGFGLVAASSVVAFITGCAAMWLSLCSEGSGSAQYTTVRQVDEEVSLPEGHVPQEAASQQQPTLAERCWQRLGRAPGAIALAALLTFAMLCMAVPGEGFLLTKHHTCVIRGKGIGLFSNWLRQNSRWFTAQLTMVQAMAVTSLVASLFVFLSSTVDYKHGVTTKRTGALLLTLSALLTATWVVLLYGYWILLMWFEQPSCDHSFDIGFMWVYFYLYWGFGLVVASSVVACVSGCAALRMSWEGPRMPRRQVVGVPVQQGHVTVPQFQQQPIMLVPMQPEVQQFPVGQTGLAQQVPSEQRGPSWRSSMAFCSKD